MRARGDSAFCELPLLVSIASKEHEGQTTAKAICGKSATTTQPASTSACEALKVSRDPQQRRHI